MKTARQQRPGYARTTADLAEQVVAVSAALLTAGAPTAPHVVAKLLRRLDGDHESVRETATALSASQRSGLRMLPRSLPLVPSVAAVFEGSDLEPAHRHTLLIVALSTRGDLDLLTRATGLTAHELTTGPVGAHLRIGRGRCELADRRMRVWLEHAASTDDLGQAHERLRTAHEERREHEPMLWHRARGAVHRCPDAGASLASAARELAERGDSERAFEVAVEAADHADGAARDEAKLIAGAAAVGAGCFEDATEWLGDVYPHGDGSLRRRALASLLIAETCAQGTVPVVDPAEHRPRDADVSGWREWARTTALTAVMSAERGRTSEMRTWLAELRDADARAGAGGEISRPAVDLCWTLSGDDCDGSTDSTGPFSGGLVPALRAAVDGDIDLGLQLLARARSTRVQEIDPLVSGFECSPLVDAYLAVAETLMHFWSGDIRTARDRLAVAAVDLPVAVPFAGLGAALAARLDISAIGAPGPLTHALSATLPSGIRIDGLVDRGLAAYLTGQQEEADTEITLWHELGAPESALRLPGLDEVGPIDERKRTEPPELTETRQLLTRIRRMPAQTWRRERDEIAATCRDLRSVFCRGRVEAMLGTTCVVRGDAVAGRRHLRAARSLFEEAGAAAWRDAAELRLGLISERLHAMSREPTAPIAVIHDPLPVESSRVAWSAVLSAREVDVAMRVVEGATNSEIAADLEISVRTVEVHVGRILATLGVRNRVQLTALAHRTGRHG
ncbi:DNA-binding CsgD family transcriptional regulator [Microbacterium ginsengiterrae]|uniref:DNA-binding CsgD family transcriptional regulator n=1 Tax=Microbacterium ginsengiterrae TaxID=546115 RepID=A0A7W9CEP2_9MICO|nr:DNA-binding CsgD family transcriptional regulator [Microbacterium ginsengiterrae]